MIDPFTAFAMAQGAVKGIKAAIALGKDINGLIKDFSKFYSAADQVHIASTKLKIANIGKSDSQINSDALQIAMASKALRDYERELKDLLFWSGNAQVWEDMMAERTRMAKERAALEKIEAARQQKKREDIANAVLTTLSLIGAISIIGPVLWIVFALATRQITF